MEFLPSGSGTLTVSFDSADGYPWRAALVLAAGGRSSVVANPLDQAGAGSTTVSGFGSRWSQATLVPMITHRPGREVLFGYAATLR